MSRLKRWLEDLRGFIGDLLATLALFAIMLPVILALSRRAPKDGEPEEPAAEAVAWYDFN